MRQKRPQAQSRSGPAVTCFPDAQGLASSGRAPGQSIGRVIFTVRNDGRIVFCSRPVLTRVRQGTANPPPSAPLRTGGRTARESRVSPVPAVAPHRRWSRSNSPVESCLPPLICRSNAEPASPRTARSRRRPDDSRILLLGVSGVKRSRRIKMKCDRRHARGGHSAGHQMSGACSLYVRSACSCPEKLEKVERAVPGSARRRDAGAPSIIRLAFPISGSGQPCRRPFQLFSEGSDGACPTTNSSPSAARASTI